MNQRNVVTCILLTLITCGLYGIYWVYALNNDVSRMTNDPEDGGTVLLLSLITCGIYYIFWQYKMGEKIEMAGGKNDGIVYLILSIFSLSIVSLALMQTEINNLQNRRGYY